MSRIRSEIASASPRVWISFSSFARVQRFDRGGVRQHVSNEGAATTAAAKTQNINNHLGSVAMKEAGGLSR